MIQSLHFRQRSPLGEDPWRAGKWSTGHDFNIQRLYDIGFDLGTIAEDLDGTIDSNLHLGSTLDATLGFHMFVRCNEIDRRLGEWYSDVIDGAIQPLYWDAPDSNKSGDPWPSVSDTPIVFLSLTLADQMAIFWSVQIFVRLLILEVRNATLLDEAGLQIFECQPITEIAEEGIAPVEAGCHKEPLLSQLISNSISKQLHDYATLITRSTLFCTSDNAGQHGQQRFLFPLRCALVAFINLVAEAKAKHATGHPAVMSAERYRDWCRGWYNIVLNEKKVGYARDLENHPSRWQARDV